MIEEILFSFSMTADDALFMPEVYWVAAINCVKSTNTPEYIIL